LVQKDGEGGIFGGILRFRNASPVKKSDLKIVFLIIRKFCIFNNLNQNYNIPKKVWQKGKEINLLINFK